VKNLTYILFLLAFSLNAQNMVIDCAETIIKENYKSKKTLLN